MPAPPRGAMLEATGPPWLGSFFHNILAGMLIVQVYIYYVAFPKDHWSMKAIVYIVFILEMTQTVIRAVDNFENDVMRWGDVTSLPLERADWFGTPVITAVTSAIVQAYFGYRVLIFSKSWIIATFIWVPTLLQLSTGVALGAISEPLPVNILSKTARFKTVLPIWTSSSAFTDILIAVLLTYYLYTMKSGIRQTDKLITKIIRLTVETGTVTAIASVLIVILFYAKPPWFLIFTDIIGKLYANNLMVMFNRRIDLGAEGATTVHSMGTGKTSTANGAESHIQFAGKSTGDNTLTSFVAKRSDKEWEMSQRGKDSFV
ncbi:hypothetical protein DL96DRAFT_1714788 [Flagelloscypha sp. PMI_526]|nr:hypothetical protein DL96DRAFT_1714788 [Flagelloscypha sp. PMI_526]